MTTRYQETLDWLYGLEARRGMDFRLERLTSVLDRLGHPERAFPAIHIAGTNGKGSTAAMLHAMYTRGGYCAGLYTSPHLLSFTERIRIGREHIAERDVVVLTERVREAADAARVDLTFFEIATLIALLEFQRRRVDLAVVETGLGGRLDATNVVLPVACVITALGLEHCDILGDTIEAIAYEKAGIIKPGSIVVTGPLPAEGAAVVARRAEQEGAACLEYGRDFDAHAVRALLGGPAALGLQGAHQERNAAVALAVARALSGRFRLPDDALAGALREVRWPGRLETVSESPMTVVDAAHNPHAAEVLAASLESLAMPRPRVLVFGVMADKDWAPMLARLVPSFDHVVVVPVANRRALDPARALTAAADLRPAEAAASAKDGVARAREIAGRHGSVLVTGSIFLVSEVYRECGGGENPFGTSESA